MATKEDYIYLAGLIDGEGCIYGHTLKRDKYEIIVARLSVKMVDKEIIDWIYKTFGGFVYKKRDDREKQYHTLWSWEVSKAEYLIPFLENIIPYLKLKKYRAKLLLDLKKRVLKTKKLYLKKIEEDDRKHREKILKALRNENQRLQRIEVDLSGDSS